MSGETHTSPGSGREARVNSINSLGCPRRPGPGRPPFPQRPPVTAPGVASPPAGPLKGPAGGGGGGPDWGGGSPGEACKIIVTLLLLVPSRAFVLAGPSGRRPGCTPRPVPESERACVRPPLPSLSRKNKEAEGAPFPPGFAPLREPAAPQYLPRREGSGAGPLLGGLPRAGAARRGGCRRIRGAARRASLSRPSRQRRRRAPLRSAPAGLGLWLWVLAAAAAAAASLLRALLLARPRRRLARSRPARARRLPLSPGPDR